MKIKEIIRELSESGEQVYSLVCKVLSVDETNRTCEVEPIDGSAGIPETRLQANINLNSGFILFPAIDSHVVVCFLNKNAAFVALFSEVDKVHLRGDQLGGLIKVEDLVTRLNNVENDLNDLKTVFNSWTPVSQDGGAALKTAAGTWFGSQIETTEKSHIENTNVNHG